MSAQRELDAFRLALAAWREVCELRYGLLTRGVYGGLSHRVRDMSRARSLAWAKDGAS